MVNVTTKDGKVLLKDIVPCPEETAHKLEAVIKTNKKSVESAMKNLNINHWVERKEINRPDETGKTQHETKFFTVASKEYSADNEIDVMEEIKSLRLTHHRFIEMLCGMGIQEPAPEQANDAPEETDEEAEKFLEYALVCKLQELVSSCSAIIIAIPK